jgi:hypothetical protein
MSSDTYSGVDFLLSQYFGDIAGIFNFSGVRVGYTRSWAHCLAVYHFTATNFVYEICSLKFDLKLSSSTVAWPMFISLTSYTANELINNLKEKSCCYAVCNICL